MTSAESLFHQARAHVDAHDFVAAEAALRAALALDPHAAALWSNFGFVLEKLGRASEAEACYRRAIVLAPQELQTCLNLGALLTAGQRLDDALTVYADARARLPDTPALLSNLGMTLACAQRDAEAEACYREALALDPMHRKAAFNLAYLLLRQGRWDEGWRRLEARAWIVAVQPHIGLPRWQGEALHGKAILVGIEGGHGDMIQLVRYCALLKAAGAARVGVMCRPVLAPLLAGLAGADEIIGVDRLLPCTGWDVWVPALSLPVRFGTTIDTVPAALPYLAAERARVERLAPLLAGPADALKVGLVWKGSPQFENDGERSLPSLAVLAPLAAVPGIRWFSLQKGVDESAGGVDGFTPVDLAPAIADFADTAALIDGLDLVITVDTSTAHVAGALGKPVWVLLSDYLTDWRWLTGRGDTPWYPGVMRLFRQPRGGGWETVVAAVAAALRDAAAARGARS